MTVSDDDLRRAFTELTMPTDRVPTLDELLTLVDGTGEERDRLTTLARALATPSGRRELDLLRALYDGVPDDAAARTAATSPAVRVERVTGEQHGAAVRRALRRWLPSSMLAAALLMVSFIALQQFRSRDESSVTRSAMTTLQLESPADRARATGAITFIWHQIPGATYELELYTADGKPGARRETGDTTVVIPASAIRVGDTRWWVTARLDDGTQVRSGTRRFEMR